MPAKIIFISGASGVGKTTLLQLLQKKYTNKPDWIFLNFDSIGVPTEKEMIKNYRSGENWQKIKTKEWINKMLEMNDKNIIVIEGQVNLEFIINEFVSHNFTNYQIVLVDCSDEVMAKRLINDRKQPNLANKNMKSWLAFLRKQAGKYEIPILDTTYLTKNQMAQKFETIFKTANFSIDF